MADFGLAKLVGRDFSRVLILTTVRGTIGYYLAPEWISGEAITAKADVFSYGMTLFEIVSGRRNVEHGKSETHSSSSSGAGKSGISCQGCGQLLVPKFGRCLDRFDPMIWEILRLRINIGCDRGILCWGLSVDEVKLPHKLLLGVLGN